jgi:hypothetical protein
MRRDRPIRISCKDAAGAGPPLPSPLRPRQNPGAARVGWGRPWPEWGDAGCRETPADQALVSSKRSGFPASRGRVSLSRPEPIFRRGGTTGLDPAEGRFRVGGDPRVAHSPLSWTDRLVVDAAADHASEPRPRSRSGHFLPNRAPWHVSRAPLRVRRVAEPAARSEETESPPQAPPPPPDLNASVGHRGAPPCGWWVMRELA